MNKLNAFIITFLLLGANALYAQKTRDAAPTSADRTSPVFDPSQIWVLPDMTPPEIHCLNGLSVNLMPTGMIDLWSSDFLAYVTDNETPVSDIKLAVRKAGSGTGFPADGNGLPIQQVTYECAEQGNQAIELWAKDLEGNTAFCTTTVIVLDNLQNCDAGQGLVEVCSFADEFGVEEVEYEITAEDAAGDPIHVWEVSSNGCSTFNYPLGSNGTITPVKDDNPLNGVTSFDWVLIKKHILGIEPFTSPYQWVAADINGDRVIDLQDSVDHYRLILGIYNELPNNTSWRFIPEDYQFPSPNPLSEPFPETWEFSNLQEATSVVFVAVKIGDVNGSAVANNFQGVVDEREQPAISRQTIRSTPNPTSDGFTLSFETKAQETTQFRLFDLSGRLTYELTQNLNEGSQTLNIPAQAMPESGIYFWKMNVGGVQYTEKVIRW